MSISLVKYYGEDELDGEDFSVEFLDAYRSLSPSGQKLLWCLLENLVSGKQLSNREVSKKTGLGMRNIQKIRSSDRFAKALSIAMREEIRGSAELGVIALEKKVLDGNIQAIKIWLEMTDIYREVRRSERKSMDLRVDASVLPGDVKREVVRRWRDMGWTKEEFIELWDSPV